MKTPIEVKQRAAQLYQEMGSTNKVADKLGVANTTVLRYLRDLGIPRREPASWSGKVQAPAEVVTPPQFPDEDIDVEEMIELQCKRFEIRKSSYDAHTWFPVSVSENIPIAILWFGDPHVDDNGCNWPALKKHTQLCKTVPGLYGANIGDTTNNWAGRLIRLYAEQEHSVKSARKLAKWLMLDSGVRWLIYLIGNHDAWGDGAEVLAQMAKQHGTQKIICHDWEARFTLSFPNGWAPRIHAAHDFKGHSQWNPLHGPMKAGQMGEEAELFVCGDKHNAAIFEWENAARGGVFQQFIRVRGYKFMDDYARRLGLPEQSTGCAIMTVFDPGLRRVTVFGDVDAGADFLTMLRSRHENAQKAQPAPRVGRGRDRGRGHRATR